MLYAYVINDKYRSISEQGCHQLCGQHIGNFPPESNLATQLTMNMVREY